MKRFTLFIASLSWLVLSGCAGHQSSAVSPLADPGVQQLVVVVSDDWNSTMATLYTFDKHDGQWQSAGIQSPVNIGRTGLAWGIGLHPPQTSGPHKQEGDGKAPAGIFNFGTAFGYLKSVNTGMRYSPMTAGDYCMDVTSSPYYNQIIDAADKGKAAVAGSSEPMRRDIYKQQQVYKKGLVVNNNPADIPGKGSCIFMHLWFGKGVPTAGCTSMPEEVMDRLLGWLDQSRHPLYVALPRAQYAQKRQNWDLPNLP